MLWLTRQFRFYINHCSSGIIPNQSINKSLQQRRLDIRNDLLHIQGLECRKGPLQSQQFDHGLISHFDDKVAPAGLFGVDLDIANCLGDLVGPGFKGASLFAGFNRDDAGCVGSSLCFGFLGLLRSYLLGSCLLGRSLLRSCLLGSNRLGRRGGLGPTGAHHGPNSIIALEVGGSSVIALPPTYRRPDHPTSPILLLAY